SELDEKGGWAALGRVDFKLADLGTLYVSGSTRSIGFGTIEQRVNERARDNFNQFDVATNLELGKLLPQKASMSIPVYAGVSQTISTPEYDPYDLDIKLKDKLAAADGNDKDSIRDDAVDVRTITTLNFTNVKKNNTSGKVQKPWSIENVDVSYSYYKETQHNPLIESNDVVRHRAGVGYNYVGTPKYWEPLKRGIKSKSNWFSLAKDLNLNYIPSLIGFRADVNRQFGSFRPRSVGTPKGFIPETYDKYFTFDRFYNLRWDLTRSLNVDYSAVNKTWIDEDSGRLDKGGKDKMWDNFFKGGRTILYQQKAEVSYNLPTAKLPLIDWTNIKVGYVSTFDWLGASLIARSLGNTLSNTQQKNVNAELDFTRLYAKSRWLRALDEEPIGADPSAQPNLADTAVKGRRRNSNDPVQLPGAVKFVGRLITSLKRVNISYSENASAAIYGYTDSSRALGMNFRSNAPGLGFIFGQQPDTNFINKFAQKGWLTGDPNFNYQNRQDYTQKLTITAQLMPIRDLT
ncbi:MAG: cell surface protein SprA, partial [Chitinophagaceae bacterium]